MQTTPKLDWPRLEMTSINGSDKPRYACNDDQHRAANLTRSQLLPWSYGPQHLWVSEQHGDWWAGLKFKHRTWLLKNYELGATCCSPISTRWSRFSQLWAFNSSPFHIYSRVQNPLAGEQVFPLFQWSAGEQGFKKISILSFQTHSFRSKTRLSRSEHVWLPRGNRSVSQDTNRDPSFPSLKKNSENHGIQVGSKLESMI